MGGLGGRPARTPFLQKGWALSRWQRPDGDRRPCPLRRRKLRASTAEMRGFPSPQEKPYGLSFRGKSAVFPLTPGRAALCRRLRVSPFSKLKRSNASWSRRGRSCRFSGNWPELRRAGQRGVFFPGRRRRPRGGRRPAREQIRGGLRERRGGHPGEF